MDQRAWQATQSMGLQRVRLNGESNTKMSLEGFRTLNLLQSRDNFWWASGMQVFVQVLAFNPLELLDHVIILSNF